MAGIIYKLLVVSFITIFMGCTHSKKITDNLRLPIASRAAWGADSPRPYQQHNPLRITIHHEGTKLELKDDAAAKIKAIQKWGMGKDRNWTDIPYHFLIAPDGTIYEGRDPLTVGETATEYDPAGHLLITCLGNLEVQEVTEAQLNSVIKAIAWACKKYNISPDTIASHRDYSTQTTCPGKNLYQFLQNGYIHTEVKKLLKSH
jgi:hypothetical protein